MALPRRRAWIIGGSIVGFLIVGWIVKSSAHYTVRLSADQIRAYLEPRFPLVKSDILYEITFTDPIVSIDDKSQRLTLGVQSMAKTLNSQSIRAKASISGSVRYEASQSAIYFDQPRAMITQLEISGLPQQSTHLVSQALVVGLERYFSSQPIYRLSERASTVLTFRRRVKSLGLRGDHLVVELGL